MSDLVLAGLNLALYGMGFVFVFLLLLVGLTILMSALVRRFSPTVAVAQRQHSNGQKLGGARRSSFKVEAPSPDQDQGRLVAVMSAAIKQHRSGLD